jgi:hypothetical protein
MPVVMQYGILGTVLVSIVLSSLCLVKLRRITMITANQNVTVGDLVKKLISHPEARAYFGVTPIAAIRIDQNNLEKLQAQVNGLDTFALGDFLVQYPTTLFMYDYAQDRILARVPLPPAQAQPPPAQPQRVSSAQQLSSTQQLVLPQQSATQQLTLPPQQLQATQHFTMPAQQASPQQNETAPKPK